MKKYECTVAMLARLGPIPCRFLHAPWLAMLLLMLVIAPRAAEAATIYVTTTQQKVTSSGGCSLQEAIYSANLQTNLAYQSGNGYISTQCIPGTGNDTLVLPTKAAFNMGNVLLDPTNYLGATATPLIFSNITIEANGSTLSGFGQSQPHRAFAVGGASITLPGGATVSGIGSL